MDEAFYERWFLVRYGARTFVASRRRATARRGAQLRPFGRIILEGDL
jgi:hypothetical protein